MGFMNGELSEEEDGASLREALLFTTMCIIGLPVEVHIKDGSVYSGIFHTAFVEKGYDIVLKKAVMTKKGKHNQTLPQVGLIETLVVLSGDIVQVVAKGVLLQSDGLGGAAGDDLDGFGGTIPSSECLDSHRKVTELKLAPVSEEKIIETRSAAQNGNGHGLLPTSIEYNLPLRANAHIEGKPMDLSYRANSLELDKPKTDDKKLPRVTCSCVYIHSCMLMSPVSLSSSGEGPQVAHGRSQEKPDDYKQQLEVYNEDMTSKLQGPSLNFRACANEEKTIDKSQAKIELKVLPDGVSCSDIPSHVQTDNQCCKKPTSPEIQSSDVISSCDLNSLSLVVDLASSQCHSSPAASSDMVNIQNFAPNRSSKEFKLNPGAKVFSPSFANTRPATTPPVPTVATMNYLPDNSPLVSVDATETDLELNPLGHRSSLPVKFVSYANLMGENGGGGSHFNQSITGYPGNRMQPVRQTGQHHHVQPGLAYAPSNPQAVMVGRLGQIVYVHPVSQETVQGAAAISPVSARPLLMPHQVQFPKQQGYAAGQVMQLCAPPPFVNTGQQQFVMPNYAQLLQPPCPLNRPIMVPGSNGFMGSKFP